ncbi:MAG: NUDIX domain-containing protein [Pikeienuella sp.]
MSMEEDAFARLGPWRDYRTDYAGAVAIPVDPMGRVLLQLRDGAAPVHPLEWGLFGGEVEKGESLAEGMIREFEEETGLRPPAAAFRPFARIVSPGSRRRLYAFTVKLAAAPEAIRLGEGAGFAFVEPKQVMRFELLAATRVLLAAWLARGGGAG